MIYPEKFPEFRQNFAEQQVYTALEALGDDFDIFYNKSFARKHAKEDLLYEIDFLVMDLRGGKFNHLFVIEVKGGNMYYNTKRNQWKSGDHYLDTAPEQQVMGYVTNLLYRYHTQLAHKVPITWLLWFPDGIKNKREYLPTHLSFWRVLDQYALANPLKNLDAAIQGLSQDYVQFQGIEKAVYEESIKKELIQTFTILPNAKALLQEMQLSVEAMEQQQKLFFTGLLGIPRLGIEGGAGSGKTLLARFSAVHLAEQGKKVLLLCFNQQLKTQLSEGMHPNTVVNTIHSFMVEQINQVDSSWFEKENKQDPDLYEERMPMKFKSLIQGRSLTEEERFDVLIVDEGQDMDGAWIETLLLHFLKNEGQAIVFFDPKQNIFQRDFYLPRAENWASMQLLYNYRNAKTINRFVNTHLGLNTQSGNVPEGIPVKIRPYHSENLVEELDRLLLRLLHIEKVNTRQITVIVDGSTQDWGLEGRELPQAKLMLRWLSPTEEKEKGNLYMTSINRFKGCESDVVILILKEPLLPISNANIRYTQLTRAKGALWVLEEISTKD